MEWISTFPIREMLELPGRFEQHPVDRVPTIGACLIRLDRLHPFGGPTLVNAPTSLPALTFERARRSIVTSCTLWSNAGGGL